MTISHLLSVHSVQEQEREIAVVCVFCSINGRTRRRSGWMRLIQHNLLLLWLIVQPITERNKYTKIPIYIYLLPIYNIFYFDLVGGVQPITGLYRIKQTNIHYLLPIYNTFYQYTIPSTNIQYLLLWLLKGVQPITGLVKKQTSI